MILVNSNRDRVHGRHSTKSKESYEAQEQLGDLAEQIGILFADNTLSSLEPLADLMS
jgi:hypothetical protein